MRFSDLFNVIINIQQALRPACVSLLLVALFSSVGCKSTPAAPLSMNQFKSAGGSTITLQNIPNASATASENVSPALQWSGAPAGTQELVLIVEDPDVASAEAFVHWIAFRIPGGARSLPADSGNSALVGQGTNSKGAGGYIAQPVPMDGKPHRYFFQLFALSAPSGVEEGVSREALLRAMTGKVIGMGHTVLRVQ